MSSKKLLVTGGCGYVGSVLTGKLLEDGHDVTVVDTQWFGNMLTPHPKLKILQEDLRHFDAIPVEGMDAIINLAAIANDPCVDLDPVMSWKVNVLAMMQLTERAIKAGVKQFIHASSGSVYGVCDAPKVTEDQPLKPLSAYNETKMVAERMLLSYSNDIVMQIIRPGTVCGISPRMRFDLMVNGLSMQALTKGEITLLGGEQHRPAIHVDDMARVYQFFLARPELTGIYNSSFQNITTREIAELVTTKIPAKINHQPSNDPRSYRICADKLLNAGFKPEKTVADAIDEIAAAYAAGKLEDNDRCYNVRWMKAHPPLAA